MKIYETLLSDLKNINLYIFLIVYIIKIFVSLIDFIIEIVD